MSATASSSALPVEATQAVTAFLAGAFEDEKTSLSEIESAPNGLLSPYLTSPPSIRLVDLIKHLGASLTLEDEMERSRAVVLLSLVVTSLISSDSLNISILFDKQATTTLAQFFASKIEDGNTVANSIAQSSNAKTEIVPGSAPEYRRKKYPLGTEMLIASIRALTALAKLSGFASEATRVTAESLLAHSNPRVHPQAIRFLIYLLMDTLLSKHRSALRSMGESFLKGYIDLVEGEKDPRNLIYIFAMDRVLLVEWEMDKEMIEAFFDITYCYFPITFRPPPDDPYGISTNTLRLALRRALTASPLLAPHALSLLIEKLQASGGNAKRDTLETLEEVMPIFGRSACLAHIKELWEGFKIEIMHATDEATSICSTKALESLLYVLYIGEEEAKGEAVEMVADMLDELEEAAKQQAKSAATILACMIKATKATSKLASQAAIDTLLSLYKEPEDSKVRGPILGHINTIIKALRETYDGVNEAELSMREDANAKEEGRFTFAKPASFTTKPVKKEIEGDARSYQGDGKPLDKFKDLLLATLAHGVKTSITRVAAVELFVNLSHLDFLDASEVRHLCDSVNDLLVDANAEQVRVQTLEALRDLGNKKVIEESTLPLLFGLLPDRFEKDIAEEQREKLRGEIRRGLGSLARLCDSTEFFDMLVIRLSTKLDLVCRCTDELDDNIGYARGLISTLSIVLEEKMKRKDRDRGRYGSLIPRLIGNIIQASIRSDDVKSVAGDRKVIREVGRLITLLTRCLDDTKQKEVGNGLYTTLINGDLGYLSRQSSILAREITSTSASSSKLDLFSKDATIQQRNTLYPIASAFIALKRESTNIKGDAHFVHQILQWTLSSQSLLQEEAGCALLANTLNKTITEPISNEIEMILASMWSNEVQMQAMLVDGSNGKVSSPHHRERRAMRIWLVMARALLIRNSAYGLKMIERVLSLLNSAQNAHASVIKEAARGLGKITSEDDILCKENGSIIRLLYKQRFVTFILPKLLEGFNQSRLSNNTPSDKIINGDVTSTSSTSSIHLIAICSLLPSLPKATLLDKLKEIFPLLILALDLPDDEAVKASTANTLTLTTAIGKRELDEATLTKNTRALTGHYEDIEMTTTNEKKGSFELVKDHISSILNRLLSIIVISQGHFSRDTSATQSRVSSDETKVACLRCLAMIARSIDYPTLHPHKIRVLKILGQRGVGVDDSKRIVRLEAVDARDAWFALKGAGEEEGR